MHAHARLAPAAPPARAPAWATGRRSPHTPPALPEARAHARSRRRTERVNGSSCWRVPRAQHSTHTHALHAPAPPSTNQARAHTHTHTHTHAHTHTHTRTHTHTHTHTPLRAVHLRAELVQDALAAEADVPEGEATGWAVPQRKAPAHPGVQPRAVGRQPEAPPSGLKDSGRARLLLLLLLLLLLPLLLLLLRVVGGARAWRGAAADGGLGCARHKGGVDGVGRACGCGVGACGVYVCVGGRARGVRARQQQEARLTSMQAMHVRHGTHTEGATCSLQHTGQHPAGPQQRRCRRQRGISECDSHTTSNRIHQGHYRACRPHARVLLAPTQATCATRAAA
jgi:hypothetical protein